MFSTGQIYFAIFFIIAFVTTMVLVYRKDLKVLKPFYKGTYCTIADKVTDTNQKKQKLRER